MHLGPKITTNHGDKSLVSNFRCELIFKLKEYVAEDKWFIALNSKVCDATQIQVQGTHGRSRVIYQYE